MMADATATKFSRYRAMVSPLARQVLDIAPVSAGDSIVLGVAPAKLLLQDDVTLHGQLVEGLRHLAILTSLTDPSGQRRDVYYPFVLHLHLRAFSLRYESLTDRMWSACEDALPACIEAVRSVEQFADTPPPPQAVALTLWRALCLYEYGQAIKRDVDVEVADAVVHQVVSQPGSGGSLHVQDPDASLDAWTYRELSGLHALANLALQRRNRTWARRVEEIASYHLEHTQPDYTTTQPWAVFAGLWSEKTAMFAEQQLHDVAAAKATAGGEGEYAQHAPMIGMLLADAADALAQFG